MVKNKRLKGTKLVKYTTVVDLFKIVQSLLVLLKILEFSNKAKIVPDLSFLYVETGFFLQFPKIISEERQVLSLNSNVLIVVDLAYIYTPYVLVDNLLILPEFVLKVKSLFELAGYWFGGEIAEVLIVFEFLFMLKWMRY